MKRFLIAVMLMSAAIILEFLSLRFSKALGFFADDEWVADVTCPDCEKSLTKSFQGVNDERDQPPEAWTAEFIRKARMIIDVRCSN